MEGGLTVSQPSQTILRQDIWSTERALNAGLRRIDCNQSSIFKVEITQGQTRVSVFSARGHPLVLHKFDSKCKTRRRDLMT